MAPRGDGVTAAQVLSPRSLARHRAEVEQDDLEYAASVYASSQGGHGSQAGPPTPTMAGPAAGKKAEGQHGMSRCYVRSLWASLLFAVLLLCGVTVMQVLLQQERAKEQSESLRRASGASVNSESAVKMAQAAHDKVQALGVTLDTLKQQNTDQAAALDTLKQQHADLAASLDTLKQQQADLAASVAKVEADAAASSGTRRPRTPPAGGRAPTGAAAPAAPAPGMAAAASPQKV